MWDLGCGTWDLGYFMLDVSSWGVYVLWFASGCSVWLWIRYSVADARRVALGSSLRIGLRLDSVHISIGGFEMSHTLWGEQVHVVLCRLSLFTSTILGL